MESKSTKPSTSPRAASGSHHPSFWFDCDCVYELSGDQVGENVTPPRPRIPSEARLRILVGFLPSAWSAKTGPLPRPFAVWAAGCLCLCRRPSKAPLLLPSTAPCLPFEHAPLCTHSLLCPMHSETPSAGRADRFCILLRQKTASQLNYDTEEEGTSRFPTHQNSKTVHLRISALQCVSWPSLLLDPRDRMLSCVLAVTQFPAPRTGWHRMNE